MNAGSPELVRGVAANKMLGRPEEIASLMVFLLSNEASFITGVDIAADGGMLTSTLGKRNEDPNRFN